MIESVPFCMHIDSKQDWVIPLFFSYVRNVSLPSPHLASESISLQVSESESNDPNSGDVDLSPHDTISLEEYLENILWEGIFDINWIKDSKIVECEYG